MQTSDQPSDAVTPRQLPVAEILRALQLFEGAESDADTLKQTSAVLAQVLAADYISLGLYDHGLSCITLVHHHGLPHTHESAFRAVAGLSPYTIPAERAVLESGKPLVRRTPEDFERFPDALPHDYHARTSDLVVPLRVGNQTVGVAYIWRRAGAEPFTDEEVDIAAAVARHAALGIQAARDVRRLQALRDVGQRLAEARDLTELVERVFTTIHNVVTSDGIALVLYGESDAQHDGCAWLQAAGGDISVQRLPAPGTLAGRPPDPVGFDQRYRSTLHLPLQASGETIGLISVGATTPNAFSPGDLGVVETIAAHAAVSIVNLRTLHAATERLQRLTLLNRVSAATSATLDLDQTCAALDIEVAGAFDTDAFLIALVPADDQRGAHEIDIVYQRDPAGLFTGSGEALRAAVWYAVHADTVVSNSPTHHGERLFQQGGVYNSDERTVAVLPMRTGDIALGALCIAATRPQAWDDEALHVLTTIARSTALAIENARIHADIAHERVRIGQLAVWQHALLEGSWIITQGSNVPRMIDAIARQLEVLLPHDGFALYTYDAEQQRLRTVLVRSQGQSQPVYWELERGRGLTWAAVLAGGPIRANNAHLDQRVFYPEADVVDPSQGEHEMVAPLIVDGRTIGSVCLARTSGAPFSDDEFEIFSTFTPYLAIALQSAQLAEHNRSVLISTIRALTAIIDTKDSFTAGHSERVGEIARRLAAQLGATAAEQRTIELAGLLHDIGKVGIPDEILSKPGPLSPDQQLAMQAHPVLGADILQATGAEELAPLIPLVRHHHERIDGGGYPDGLHGDDIPLGAAIIAVAETYDVLTTSRPYSAAIDSDAALSEIRRHAGSQFHPRVVDALEAVLERDDPSGVEVPITRDGAPGGQPAHPSNEMSTLTVLNRLASAISSVSDLDAFLDGAARIISDELGYDTVDVLLPSEGSGPLYVRAHVSAGDQAAGSSLESPDDGIAGQAVRSGQPVILSGPERHAGDPPSAVAVPLIVEGTTVGVVVARSQRPNAFSENDARILTVIAAQLAPAVELARVHDQMKRAAQRDGLTGIYNHASFYARLDAALEGDEPVAVLLFDVDGLKHINDTAGHLAGDHVLRRIAMALELATRPDDLVARYGGDEFAIVVTGVTETQAGQMAERLIRAVNSLTWGAAHDAVSISVGLAVAQPGEAKATELVALADQRMYAARSGKHDRAIPPRPQERRRHADSDALDAPAAHDAEQLT